MTKKVYECATVGPSSIGNGRTYGILISVGVQITGRRRRRRRRKFICPDANCKVG